MQRHEVEEMTLAGALALPVAGWLLAAVCTGLPLLPLPRALTAALARTPAEPALLAGAIAGAALAVATGWVLRRYGDDGCRGAPYQRWLRGARMANWHTVAARVRAVNRRHAPRTVHGRRLAPILIGPMPMPVHLENRNLLICASVGAGKSVAMESMIASAVRRRDKLVVVDPNGTFYSQFGFPGDTILNPFDVRSAGWTLFNEIRGVHDFARMAKSVIPPQRDPNDEHWCAYVRDVLADTMRKLVETGKPDQEALVNLLVREDGDVIRDFLANTDSRGYFRENAEKAVASIQFMMNKYVRPLRFMPAGDFSLHRWVHDPRPGNLFITWREDMRAEQRPLVATWIDTICASILSAEPDGARRLWLFLDELDSLGKLESFVPAASRGRKHGLRIVGSIQDWAQFDETYGRDAARALLGCFRNYLVLGAANAYNAERASQILGRQHVERQRLSRNQGGGRSGATRSRYECPPEPIVLDAEIANLNDLTGYLMFAEDFPVARITLPLRLHPRRAAALQMHRA